MSFADRLLTIVVTATLTSAAWIVFGTMHFGTGSDGVERPRESAPDARSEVAEPGEAEDNAGRSADLAAPLGRDVLPPGRGQFRQLMVPVLGVRPADLVDTFSDERGGATRLHAALDIMAPAGTSVVAAGPGTLERLFRSEVGGRTVYVRSDNRETIFYYAHLDEYEPGLKEGQKIRRGQRLGTVGSSGNADPEAPHLHFAIMRTSANAQWWEPATSLNPYPLLRGQPASPLSPSPRATQSRS